MFSRAHALAMAVVASSLTERFRRSISHERGSGVSLPPCFRRFLRRTCARDHPQSTGFSRRLGALPSAASIFAVAAFAHFLLHENGKWPQSKLSRSVIGVEPSLTAREHSQKPLRPVPIIVMHSASYLDSRGPFDLHRPVWRHLTHFSPAAAAITNIGAARRRTPKV